MSLTISSKTKGYALEYFDYILLTATWGNPEEWKHAEYLIELEKFEANGLGKCTVPLNRKFISSTLALKYFLHKEVGIKPGLLAFSQDTILLSRLLENPEFFEKSQNIKRRDILNSLYKELYYAKEELAKELEMKDYEEYKKFVVFVPGVISTAKGADVLTWRGEHIYDVISGIIVAGIYKKFVEESNDARRIAILMDTTHGINYLVTAFSQGVVLASLIYALYRLAINNRLEDLVIYHYNSDPLAKESEEPLLKLHLLRKISVVKNNRISLYQLFSIIENSVKVEGLNNLSGKMYVFWKEIDKSKWRKILETLLLFIRGALVWALRLSSDIDHVPHLDHIVDGAKDVYLEFKKERTIPYKSLKVTYRWGEKTPHIIVVIASLVLETLRLLLNKIHRDVNSVSNILDYILQKLNNYREKVDPLIGVIENWKQMINSALCISLDKLIEYVELYEDPQYSINLCELKKIRRYLRGKEKFGWKKLIVKNGSIKVYVEPKTENAWFIELEKDEIRALITSVEKDTDCRNFYAHAGLAYDTGYIALYGEKLSETLLCLSSAERILETLFRDQA